MPNLMRFEGSIHGEFHNFEIDVDGELGPIKKRLQEIQSILQDGGQPSREDTEWAWGIALLRKELLPHAIRPL